MLHSTSIFISIPTIQYTIFYLSKIYQYCGASPQNRCNFDFWFVYLAGRPPLPLPPHHPDQHTTHRKFNKHFGFRSATARNMSCEASSPYCTVDQVRSLRASCVGRGGCDQWQVISAAVVPVVPYVHDAAGEGGGGGGGKLGARKRVRNKIRLAWRGGQGGTKGRRRTSLFLLLNKIIPARSGSHEDEEYPSTHTHTHTHKPLKKGLPFL